MEEVEVLGEGRGAVAEFHKEGANSAAKGVGEGVGELFQTGLAGGVTAGKHTGDHADGVVRLQALR